jgi:PTS system galactitol-specific IIB component
MAKRYTILCACGSSIATSTVVAAKLSDLLQKNNLEETIKKTTYGELAKDVKQLNPDLILSSTNLKEDFGVPCLNALPYLTGVGRAKLDSEILAILKEEE